MHLNADKCYKIETLNLNAIIFVSKHCPLAHTNGFNSSKTSKLSVTLKKNWMCCYEWYYIDDMYVTDKFDACCIIIKYRVYIYSCDIFSATN